MSAVIVNANAMSIPLADCSVQCVVTSPPYYGLRDYGTATWEGGESKCDHKQSVARHDGGRTQVNGFHGSVAENSDKGAINYRDTCAKCGARRIDHQLGLERTPEEYVAQMVAVFREVKRVLRNDGVCFLNIGDSYWGGKGQSSQAWSTEHQDRDTLQKAQHQITGLGETRPTDGRHETIKPKDLIGIPWRVALALQADGWYLRSDIIWAKPNPMPESVTDRPTKSHEYIFLLAKSQRYYWDQEAVREAAQDWGIRDRSNMRGGTVDPKLKHHGLENGNNAESGRNLRSVWTIATQPTGSYGETYHLARVLGDEPCDGKRRITSPCCPVHGGSLVQLANNLYGELQGDGSIRNVHTYGYLDQVPPSGLPSTPVIGGLGDSSYEHLRQSCSLSAIDHNNGKNKKGRVPETNQPCNSYVETVYHTYDKPESRGLFEQDCCIPSNNMAEPYLLDGLSVQTLSSTVCSIVSLVPPGCTCSFYHLVAETSSHFATMPEELARRCIAAGTSERGACPKCGKAWVRKTERINESTWQKRKELGGATGGSMITGNKQQVGSLRTGELQSLPSKEVVTVGWHPACTCNAGEPVPCIVLDPFCGSGTTLKVALNYGRRGVGLDLSYKYLHDIAKRRTTTEVALL